MPSILPGSRFGSDDCNAICFISWQKFQDHFFSGFVKGYPEKNMAIASILSGQHAFWVGRNQRIKFANDDSSQKIFNPDDDGGRILYFESQSGHQDPIVSLLNDFWCHSGSLQ